MPTSAASTSPVTLLLGAGDPAQLGGVDEQAHHDRSWSKKPFRSLVVVLHVRDVVVLVHADRQPVAARGDGLRQLVEEDLEAAEALIEEVLGLVAQAAAVGLGGLEDLAGPLLGGADDLGALHHPLGLDPGGFEQLVGLARVFGDELLAFLQHPPRLAQLVRQAVQRLLEQLDDLLAIDARRRRQRHVRRRGDDVDRPAQQRLGVADVAARPRRPGASRRAGCCADRVALVSSASAYGSSSSSKSSS